MVRAGHPAAVVTRKVSGGNRSWLGALTQEVLASVHATSPKQGINPVDVFMEIHASAEPAGGLGRAVRP